MPKERSNKEFSTILSSWDYKQFSKEIYTTVPKFKRAFKREFGMAWGRSTVPDYVLGSEKYNVPIQAKEAVTREFGLGKAITHKKETEKKAGVKEKK